VLLVLYAMCKLVFLNNLAIALVRLPIYVNVIHFLFGVMLVVLFVFCLLFCMNAWGEYPLLCNIVFINWSSWCNLNWQGNCQYLEKT
jgi:hypothetical protein